MKKRTFILLTLFGLLFTACVAPKHIYLTGCNYHQETKSTNFSYIGDYGFIIDISGNWKYLRQDNSSKDFVFSDSLGHQLFIFVGGKGKSTFNKADLDDVSFVKAFYNWDIDWILKNSPGSSSNIIEQNDEKYIICKITMKDKIGFALYGLKKGFGVRFSLESKSDDLTNKDFLLQLYNKLK
jgi:hypothetical protein